MTDSERKRLVSSYERMMKMAELNALSKYSLEHPLSDKEFSKMMKLKKELFK